MSNLIDPQQELFSHLKTKIQALGYDVYDGLLPPENTEYPFVYLGDFRQSDSVLKNAITGIVYSTIHVWHNNPRQRGTVSRMLLDIKTVCFELGQTAHFVWHIRNTNQQIFADNTTKAPLMHGVLESEFQFS